MSGGYQQQVFNQPALGVPGDVVTANPRATLLAGPGGLVAGAGGVKVGNFAWIAPPSDPNGTNQQANNFGSGNVAGFVYNVTQALNTVFLSDGSLVIPEGLPVALAIQGDFLVINSGASDPIPYVSKAYANFADGSISFAAPGSPTAAASATGSTVTAETFSVTGSIVNDILTVTNVGSGTVYPGASITGTGILGTPQIASQLTQAVGSGGPGGAGTYLLTGSQQKTVASTTISGTYGLLTIGTLTTTPTFQVGQTVTGTNVVAGTSITANVTGSGGSGGTMVVNNNTAIGTPQVIATVANVETKFYAASAGGLGQQVKITSWVGPNG